MKTIIIAEAGVNHNGNIKLAEQLIDVGAQAGVDFVKFQTFKTAHLVSKHAPKALYQKKNTSSNQSQYDMLKKLELDKKTHQHLIQYCQKRKVHFLSTAFDLESIDLLNNLKIPLFKIPSGEITNLTYLKKIGGLKKKIILSTGMATLGEIEDALNVLIASGTAKKNITVLHCNTEYPTPWKDVNLKAMLTIQQAFGVDVGYSDHTLGIEVPIAAVALGACVIEKHFTLDRTMEGPDHQASLEPDELIEMVKAIRHIELAMGDGLKKPSSSETKNKIIARKSIHLAVDLKKGETIQEKHLIMKRPGDGISPMKIEEVIGKKTNKKLNSDHKLCFSDLL